MDNADSTVRGLPCAQQEPKLFTLEQANRALPLVRRVVSDLVEAYASLRTLLARRRNLPANHVQAELDRIDAQAAAQAERVGGLVEEIQTIGCELKDCESGMIDFRAMHQGRVVYLCWKLGEARIEAWHELDAGFAGRQDIAAWDTDSCATA